MISTKSLNNLFVFTVFSALVWLAAAAPVYAGSGSKKSAKLWRQVAEETLQARGQRAVTPEKYLVFRLNRTILNNSLAALPLENTDAARENPLLLEIPMPDGTFQKFRMEETKVLSPELQADFPDWKTFVGYGVDDPTLNGRFDWNANGFHGYISTAKGMVMIDPYQKGARENYVVFYKHEFGAPTDEFYCRVGENMKDIILSGYDAGYAPNAPQYNYGATVRTYRLAVATTGEWARNAAGYNGTQNPIQIRTAALAVVQTTVNRLNGIYLRELSSQFTLANPDINNNATNIIFDDPASDPYVNNDTDAELNSNQTTIDTRVGTANYDIGHLYGTGGGGYAASPSLCRNGTQSYPNAKAQGYSARGTNTGDPFTVDYVAHEIGHQFGASHTYNNRDTGGACTTRSAAQAFEVASGSTLLSYVGICDNRNLQQYVDTGLPSFHIASLTQIINNINTDAPNDIAGCGTTSGANSIPTVGAGAAYTIPKLTPFTLTAAGGDADAGDVSNLLYSWEEYDLSPQPSGVAGTPPGTYDEDLNGVLFSQFRAYSPVSSNQRTFPSLTFILNTANNSPAGSNQPPLTYTGTHPTNAPGAVCETSQTCVVGERLPTQNRTMNFRVSVRDRRGGVADAGTTVTVAAGAGPFQITTQNSRPVASDAPNAPNVTWQAGTTQTETWDVANTAAAPVSAAAVNILLSTDGGLTFPITLASNVANNGSATITVPNNPTAAARIKVEAVGNIFFDINNANFAITAPTAAAVIISGRVVSLKGRGIFNATVKLIDQNGSVRAARTNSSGYYSLSGIAAGQLYIFSVEAKNFVFEPQTLFVTEDVEALNFTAQ